tara:strand:+ start:170 stop:439 length:270 start_codon:yes stop_codon:yes gene_type:complete
MAKVEIYTWQYCPFCIRAKSLLKEKRIDFIEHHIDGDEVKRSQMRSKANGRNTVPQIFVNDIGIGGCDELYELERKNQLDALLSNGEQV